MSDKIGRNDSCPCCSGEKFKNCCIDLKQPTSGTLRHAYDFGTSNETMNRLFFQILNIRDKVYDGKEKNDFDKKHEAVFQNLYEAMLAKEKCESLIHEHRRKINSGEGCSYNEKQGSITITDSIDNELNMAFKDFFIRGKIATDATISLISFMGYSVSFVFKSDKNFDKDSKKFLEENDTEQMRQFVKGMKGNRESWYDIFNKIRNDIEHKGFKVPQIKYGLNDQNQIMPMHFKIGDLTITEVLDICWSNLFRMCEEMIVVFLAIKLPDSYIMVEIPEDERDEKLPVRFEAIVNMGKFNQKRS